MEVFWILQHLLGDIIHLFFENDEIWNVLLSIIVDVGKCGHFLEKNDVSLIP